jgi:hypothetical protein
MQFTSVNKKNGINVYSPENQKPQMNQFINRVVRIPSTYNTSQPSVNVNKPTPIKDNIAKPMKWGPPIWFLFHTIAEKIKEDQFLKLKPELISNIITICTNLPCPTCAAHATDYMKSVNFNTIRSKEDLKTLFFNFHNSVNIRKGYAIFSRSELNDKYSKAVTANILNYFIIHFQNKHKSIHMISDDIYRQRISNNLQAWFLSNIDSFDP